MNKYYIFLASAPIDHKYFEESLDSLEIPYHIEYLSKDRGYIIADENFFIRLDGIINPMYEDMGVSMAILISHKYGDLERKLLIDEMNYFPNQILFVEELILKEFSFGDYTSLPLLTALFKEVSRELLQTAFVFLRCGLNATLASEKLIIHRNTFNYRLAKFIDKTGLDIRDYHNAALLETYFHFGNYKPRNY
ncbi:MAG: helix-turn-helix domain-containing protein [Bacilli bacterium]|nr:helix-turn-helix domain-containing protein [Bacilli bacterium]